MSRPKLLDLFACEGGASVGYDRAGWDVTAVDLDKNRLKYNPFESFVADALVFVDHFGDQFDAVHASPPCQWYTRGNAKGRAAGNSKWSRSIPPIREALVATGLPYVLENVRDAGWDMLNPVLLCGCQFGLSVRDYSCTASNHEDRIAHAISGACDRTNGVTVHLERGRLFETNWNLTAPRACEGVGQPRNNHPTHEWTAGSYGGARRDKYEARYIRRGGYVPPDMGLVKALLGIEHRMTWNGLYECLPPIYTEHVGTQLLAHLANEAAA